MPEIKKKISKASETQLNPQIASIEIGIRNLRTIKIYPLSLGDQLATTDLLTETIQAFFKREEAEDDAEFVGFLVNTIRDNIVRLIDFVTDKEEDAKELLKEISNVQAVQIADLIYEMNFGSIAKNVASLVEKLRKLFPSTRRFPTSLKDIQDMSLGTSTESPIEKEESPSDN